MFGVGNADNPSSLKPMSCPCHVQLFNKRVRSYRDLPVRYAEFGAVHRAEPSGSLHGLLRARAFTQDDAHVLCMEGQIESEVARFCDLLRMVYSDFGFHAFDVALSTRPAVRAGDDSLWDRAEAMLASAATAAGLRYMVQNGEGAFYGPKLEFHLIDRQQRKWQCGTVQLDFVLPERLNATYVNSEGEKQHPVMIHHAVLGSIERFIGMLLEHYEGWLPAWLAPDQIVVANLGQDSLAYAEEIADRLDDHGLRVARDFRSERLPRKIVDARSQCVPVMAIAGAREAKARELALRERNGETRSHPLDEALAYLFEALRSPSRKQRLALM
jgi:threonyl-tRNA synthetase